MMIRALLIVAALSPVSFCATVHNDAPLPSTVCPTPAAYSPAFEAAAAAQARATVPKDSPLAQYIIDYGKERAALRACLAPH